MANEVNAVKDMRRADGGIVVELQGDIDMNCAPEVQSALADVYADKPSLIIVNMQNVSYIDSSGIGTLVEAFRRARNLGGRLVLCCVNDRVRGVLEITRLSDVFTQYPTEADALAQ